jgi:hypothetical protein
MTISVDNVDTNSNLVDANNFSACELIPASVLASTLEWTLILIFWCHYQCRLSGVNADRLFSCSAISRPYTNEWKELHKYTHIYIKSMKGIENEIEQAFK